MKLLEEAKSYVPQTTLRGGKRPEFKTSEYQEVAVAYFNGEITRAQASKVAGLSSVGSNIDTFCSSAIRSAIEQGKMEKLKIKLDAGN